MEKKLCPIHSYYYSGNECPICAKERLEKMASRWVPENIDSQKERFEKKKNKNENMDKMLEKLKEKFNKR